MIHSETFCLSNPFSTLLMMVVLSPLLTAEKLTYMVIMLYSSIHFVIRKTLILTSIGAWNSSIYLQHKDLSLIWSSWQIKNSIKWLDSISSPVKSFLSLLGDNEKLSLNTDSSLNKDTAYCIVSYVPNNVLPCFSKEVILGQILNMKYPKKSLIIFRGFWLLIVPSG